MECNPGSILHVGLVFRLHAGKSVVQWDSQSSDTHECSTNDCDRYSSFQIAASVRIWTVPFLCQFLGKLLQKEISLRYYLQHEVVCKIYSDCKYECIFVAMIQSTVSNKV